MNSDSTSLSDTLRPRLAADRLWDFALALYARPGVEAACLRLQDEAGVDVCELLWHCWLYHHGLMVTGEPEGLVEIRRWQREVTVPLRQLRRTLKAEAQQKRGVADVRQHLKHAELAAERETLSRLQTLAEHGNGIHSFGKEPPCLAKYLASRLAVQKKSQLSALKTLETRLDPPTEPR
ncbi:TIGR02444 family protein [Litchfieldella qijiaojingensis]|nr:TIGR02444 family protein [Halomonas qijiaojingensis]